MVRWFWWRRWKCEKFMTTTMTIDNGQILIIKKMRVVLNTNPHPQPIPSSQKRGEELRKKIWIAKMEPLNPQKHPNSLWYWKTNCPIMIQIAAIVGKTSLRSTSKPYVLQFKLNFFLIVYWDSERIYYKSYCNWGICHTDRFLFMHILCALLWMLNHLKIKVIKW